MKKILLAAIFAVAMSFASCGHKTANSNVADSTSVDSVDTTQVDSTDTTKVDSTVLSKPNSIKTMVLKPMK